jgi:hypothetical protein
MHIEGIIDRFRRVLGPLVASVDSLSWPIQSGQGVQDRSLERSFYPDTLLNPFLLPATEVDLYFHAA